MSAVYSVSLQRLIKEFSLEAIYLPKPAEEVLITTTDINRPGLHLAGFMEHFDKTRVQVLGKIEAAYLEDLSEELLHERVDCFFAMHPATVIISRGLELPSVVLEAAQRYEVPLLRTQEATSTFLSGLIALLNVELAPRITRHGVLVEVYGEGVLLLGESGVGKSETAIELVKRGHRLIADDAVEIRRVSNKTLVGSAPENIRHYVELRGIGIINARRIFGMGSVKMTEKIDMIIQLEQWDSQKVYDRMGVENEYATVLGIRVPSLLIPVKPGRNLAIIIEVAAMNNRQKKMGYNAAQELLEKLGIAQTPSEEADVEWDMF